MRLTRLTTCTLYSTYIYFSFALGTIDFVRGCAKRYKTVFIKSYTSTHVNAASRYDDFHKLGLHVRFVIYIRAIFPINPLNYLRLHKNQHSFRDLSDSAICSVKKKGKNRNKMK